MPIDSFDAKILNELQRDNMQSAAKISDKVGLSASAVNRRIASLTEEGIITENIALVAWKAVGFSVRVRAVCTLDRDKPDTRDRFMTALQEDRMVVRASSLVSGEADFALEVVARDIDAYEEHMRHYQEAFPSLRSLRSYVLDGELKRGYVIPVEAQAAEYAPSR